MREILGRRRGFMWSKWSKRERATPRAAALTYAERWHWPVLPGVGCALPADERRGASRGGAVRACGCARVDCAVPGAHPHDPELLAATTDPRMVGWWWTKRPDAPVLLATGRPVSAVSLPASAGVKALATLDAMGVRLGPVVATPTRTALLVAPYSMEELGELLYRHDWVPSSLRYHGPGGYVVLPPSRTGAGRVGWERAPQPGPGGGAPWLPDISVIVDTLVEAGSSAPDGSRLAY